MFCIFIIQKVSDLDRLFEALEHCLSVVSLEVLCSANCFGRRLLQLYVIAFVVDLCR
jgi:hypothetical protein